MNIKKEKAILKEMIAWVDNRIKELKFPSTCYSILKKDFEEELEFLEKED